MNAAELNLIISERPVTAAHVPGGEFWLRLLRERNVLVLCLMYVPNSVTFYFCITWLPTYLEKRHHFKGGGLDCFRPAAHVERGQPVLGGFCSDRIVARYGLRAGRRIPGIAGYSVAAVALFCAAATSNSPKTAAVLIAVRFPQRRACSPPRRPGASLQAVDIGREAPAVVSTPP